MFSCYSFESLSCFLGKKIFLGEEEKNGFERPLKKKKRIWLEHRHHRFPYDIDKNIRLDKDDDEKANWSYNSIRSLSTYERTPIVVSIN